ncbi:hypothetical protein L207DRAFT_575529 [Hyaloscypha variabilis F]|uniref:Uncharacterized protein n=1 Tax=Hyaloscypha variabilis (strain UAMH 11265 / GT02V1 / F) TaxID=1149755 RepID=A0A2J6SDP5_HYAVF|nr:hypothetical protein L207DRAFT_575529 [Hyaloscypha variabilis F]
MRFFIPTMIAMLALVSGIAGLALPWDKVGSEVTARVAGTEETDDPCFDDED